MPASESCSTYGERSYPVYLSAACLGDCSMWSEFIWWFEVSSLPSFVIIGLSLANGVYGLLLSILGVYSFLIPIFSIEGLNYFDDYFDSGLSIIFAFCVLFRGFLILFCLTIKSESLESYSSYYEILSPFL